MVFTLRKAGTDTQSSFIFLACTLNFPFGTFTLNLSSLPVGFKTYSFPASSTAYSSGTPTCPVKENSMLIDLSSSFSFTVTLIQYSRATGDLGFCATPSGNEKDALSL